MGWRRVFWTRIVMLLAGILACEPHGHPPLHPALNTRQAVAPAALPNPEPFLASNPIYESQASLPQSMSANETRVSRHIASILHERGVEPVADARLEQVAQWMAHRDELGETPSITAIDSISRRAGHVGALPLVVVVRVRNFDTLSESALDDELHNDFGRIPNNLVLDHYGVATVGTDSELTIAIAVAAVEVVLDPLPKHVHKGAATRMAGRVADRFAGVRLSITSPTGRVRSLEKAGRQFAVDLVPDSPGVYRLELLGEGTSGPVVVANLPIYVDVEEPTEIPTGDSRANRGGRGEADPDRIVTAVQVEEQLLKLLNEARAKAGIGPLLAHDALASVARAHSNDMADHGFVGHVSPTTGGPGDRLQQAGLHPTLYGENVAQAGSAPEAFAGLMDSPAHRANMLDARFTHVGIGAVVREQPGSKSLVTMTLVFAR